MADWNDGGQLKAAREAQQLSLFEVARQLHLLQSVVEAMEQGRQPANVPVTFWRGYLRAYASLLGVSLRGLDSSPAFDQPAIKSGYRDEQISSRHVWPITWFIVALLIGLVLLWWQDNRNGSLVEELPIPVLPAPLTENAVSPPLPVELPIPEPVSSTANPAESASETSDTPKPLADAEQPGLLEPNLLEFSFTGTCWLKVVDADSKTLFAGTKSKGQPLRLQGKLPYKLTLGNPQAVNLLLGGQAIDLSRYPRGRVARLSVGD